MTRPAALISLLSTAALSALLGGCAAFNLGPDSDAARPAYQAVRGYPRLVDVPPEPEDVHCLRAAIGAPTPPRVDLNVQVSDYANVLDAVRAASSEVAGGDDEDEDSREADEEAGDRLADCPPDVEEEAERLVAERARLEEAAREIRAAAPAPASGEERPTLPDDIGAVALPGQGPEASR